MLVVGLVAVNGILAGSEIALISLRESQLARMEREGRTGLIVATLARDPNRFLATIQIGITLAGFLASAAAAVTLSEPLQPLFGIFGEAADTVAIVAVTLVLSFVTLVFGELAPKRLALQRVEGWALFVGRGIHWMAVASKPLVWLLGVSTDLVVRIVGGKPGSAREEVDIEEIREMVIAHRALTGEHQEVLVGAFEVAERTLREVLVPRRDVFTVDATMTVREAIDALLETGHSRAPVVPEGELDDTLGIAHLRSLLTVNPGSMVSDHVAATEFFPESVRVLAALRRMQEHHQQMAFVVNEFGGIDGIVTVEDLIEEVVGEIYDESDRDVLLVEHEPDGSFLVPGRFPVHDLVDIGIEVPPGEYTTVAGLVLHELGRVPATAGERFSTNGWEVTVLTLRRRRVGRVRFRRVAG